MFTATDKNVLKIQPSLFLLKQVCAQAVCLREVYGIIHFCYLGLRKGNDFMIQFEIRVWHRNHILEIIFVIVK